MKLPFEFATKLLLRLVLPGAMLTALFWPALVAMLSGLDIAVDAAVSVPVAVLVLGWGLLLADMPIYMLMEGRRFWPERLRTAGLKREEARLQRLLSDRALYPAGSAQRVEATVQIRTFPIGFDGQPYARYPTRFGNLVTASETYPDRKYGVDGVFGWYRLWVAIDQDLRAEIDDRQAMVDSSLYACVIAAAAAPICLIYASIALVRSDLIPVLPSPVVLLVLAVMSVIASRFFYAAACSTQESFGEIFAALFDQNIDKLRFDTLLAEIAKAKGDLALATAAPRVRSRAAIRFLKHHRYRPSSSTVNEVVEDW